MTNRLTSPQSNFDIASTLTFFLGCTNGLFTLLCFGRLLANLAKHGVWLIACVQKAGGDVKKVGKPDPYAYVPLQHQFLNKRYNTVNCEYNTS